MDLSLEEFIKTNTMSGGPNNKGAAGDAGGPKIPALVGNQGLGEQLIVDERTLPDNAAGSAFTVATVETCWIGFFPQNGSSIPSNDEIKSAINGHLKGTGKVVAVNRPKYEGTYGFAKTSMGTVKLLLELDSILMEHSDGQGCIITFRVDTRYGLISLEMSN